MLALSGCGGHVKERSQSPSTGGGGSGGESGAPIAGATTGGAPPDLVGCPDAAWFEECPAFWRADLDFSWIQPEPASIWAEALQIPEYVENPLTPSAQPPPPSETWDRSPLPEGACVFRLHGVATGCLSPTMSLQLGSCASSSTGEPRIIPLSYYELDACGMNIAPGCQSADPWSFHGNYWYAVPGSVGAAEATIVVCSPLCNSWLGQRACLVAGLD